MKNNTIAFLSISVIIMTLLSGCAGQNDQTQNQNTENITKESMEETTDNSKPDTPQPKKTAYSMAEIQAHNKKGDCWLLIAGKVYDVSEYSKHPGGEAILEGCGKDATTLFETRPMGSGTPHSDKARGFMTNYEIGELETS